MIITEGKTIQQVSDEIAAKLIVQGHRCILRSVPGIGSMCSYNDGNGNHCAIGWLLPEDHRCNEHHGGINSLISTWEDIGTNDQFIRDNWEILEVLQDVHDNPSQLEITFLECNGLDMTAWGEWISMDHTQRSI